MEKYEKTTSQFNEAAFQISRLHNIWNECKTHRESGQLLKWKFKLDGAAIELKFDAKKLDGEQKNSYVKKLEKLDHDIFFIEIRIALKKEETKFTKILYEKLKEKEELLREIQEASGKGGKYRDFDDEGM